MSHMIAITIMVMVPGFADEVDADQIGQIVFDAAASSADLEPLVEYVDSFGTRQL